MPRILIKEYDETSPGTPSSYSNYSVLLTGFSGRKATDNDRVKPDSNGVYEFSSVQTFEDVIGLVSPKLYNAEESSDYEQNECIYHYGNQMAYELLKLGYSIIYKPIETVAFASTKQEDGTDLISHNEVTNYKNLITALNKLAKEDFWEIFKDKASYDFRFVSHGLLESGFGRKLGSVVDPETWEDLENIQKTKDYLAGIESEEKYNEKTIEDLKNYTGLVNDTDTKIYSTLENAKKGITGQLDDLRNTEDYLDLESEETYTNATIENLKKYIGLVNDKGEKIYSTLKNAKEGIEDQITELSTTINYLDGIESEEKYNEKTIEDLKNYTGLVNDKDEKMYSTLENAKKGINDQVTELSTKLDKSITDNTFNTGTFNTVNGCIANLALYNKDDADNSNKIPGRGDCTALIELDEVTYKSTTSDSRPEVLIIDAINDVSDINENNGKFCAMTVPSVTYKMSENKVFSDNKKFPGAFHYLACFANSLQLGFAEWYAAAGYTRGVSNYLVDYTTVKLGEIAVNALEPRYYDEPQKDYPKFACNVIANFRGSYYLWGNRTAQPLGKKGNLTNGDLVASSFLNIRQLCNTIKKQLYVACRTFTFDPNSDTLWVNFKNAITPTLEAMKADQGIRDYKVLKVIDDPKKATLKAKVRIIPIEAVEDFDLEIWLEDSFGETTALVKE
jgi:hypothetical protein